MTNNVKALPATSSVQRATASQCGAIASRFSCLPNLEPIAREAWAAKKDADPQVCMNGKLYALIKDFFESWAKASDETAALTNSLVQQFLGSAEGQMNFISTSLKKLLRKTLICLQQLMLNKIVMPQRQTLGQ